MFTPTRTSRFSPILLAVVILAFVTAACGFQTYSPGRITEVIDLSLNEELFSQSAPTFEVHGHDFWDGLLVDVNRMELHDGYLRFLGSRIMPDGSRQPASIDASLGTDQGDLTARVIAVDIPGIKLTDPVIVGINQDLRVDLSPQDFDPFSDLQFEKVQVTEDALLMQVKVTVRF